MGLSARIIWLMLWTVCVAQGQHCDFPQIKNGGLYEKKEQKPDLPVATEKSFEYYCNRGFLPPSRTYWDRIHCTARGWEPAVPCRRLCGIYHIENGEILQQKGNYIQDESVSVECCPGYSLPNDQDTITCTENGWSPEPKCIRVSGIMSDLNTYFRDASNKIFRIFESSGFSNVNDFDFKSSCIKKCLKSNIEIQNGFLSESDLTYDINRKTQFRCKQGYVTANGETSGTVTCLQNGWSAQPACFKFCDRPVFENAGTKNNSIWFKLNDKLDYECHVGYENRHKDTKGSIICNYDGWSDRPSCFEKECSIPFLDQYLLISPIKDKYKVGDLLKFSCRQGHRVGPDSVQCYSFGWSPSFPTCKGKVRSCDHPPDLFNGKLRGTKKEKYSHGEVVEYDCKPRFLLKGPNKIQCIDGKWTTLPKCIATDQLGYCKTPTLADMKAIHAKKIGFNQNFILIYKCRGIQNYKFSICLNGVWIYEPTCTEKESCPPPPQIPNAQIMETTVKYLDGEKVSVLCQDNYILQNTEEMVCKDGRWQSLPRCVAKIPCSQPPKIDHGSIKLPKSSEERRDTAESRSYEHGTTLSYACDDGFRMAEEHGVTCHMGKWSAPPHCVGLPCGPPPSIHHGIVSHGLDSYQHGEEVTYSCSEGFGINGPAFIKCVGGKWPQPPDCKKKGLFSLFS
ncbi:complement factor H-like [Microtus oregoni]|uniref:complement factor H-like n=1 Tax=Microtus oregoni TaxID=111838 RepID=UPI001BB1A368|nr:complement factor H-like [Microtus oregoni]